MRRPTWGSSATPARPHTLAFWVRRYAPAELACLVTMLAASVLASTLTTSAPLLAASAIGGATVGFYGVLVVAVWREQRTVVASGTTGYARRVAARTVLLLVAEFGTPEILDTFLWRPALMIAGVSLLENPILGLLAGKLASDTLFYALSAVGFRATQVRGARGT